MENHTNYINLLTKVAHDICSPIAILEIGLQRLRQLKLNEDANIYTIALQRIRDITADLRQIQLKNCDRMTIGDILYQVLELKRYEWQGREYKLEVSIEKSSCNISLVYNNHMLQRVFSNLLNNAFEACQSEPYIKIICRTINNKTEISISDNGCGMNSIKIKNYMDGESTKHNYKGLGLSSAKEYIHSIGGSLFINSKLGEGTIIIIKI